MIQWIPNQRSRSREALFLFRMPHNSVLQTDLLGNDQSVPKNDPQQKQTAHQLCVRVPSNKFVWIYILFAVAAGATNSFLGRDLCLSKQQGIRPEVGYANIWSRDYHTLQHLQVHSAPTNLSTRSSAKPLPLWARMGVPCHYYRRVEILHQISCQPGLKSSKLWDSSLPLPK